MMLKSKSAIVYELPSGIINFTISASKKLNILLVDKKISIKFKNTGKIDPNDMIYIDCIEQYYSANVNGNRSLILINLNNKSIKCDVEINSININREICNVSGYFRN